MSNVHSLDKLKKDAEDPSKKKEYVGNGTNVEGPPRAVLESQEALKKHSAGVDKGEFKFSLWRNGIVLGEPTHETVPIPLDSADGREILAAMEGGRAPIKFLPEELRKKAAAGQVNIAVEDHRGEAEGFKAPPAPPAPKYIPFGGAANSLGGGGGAPAAAGAVVQDSAGCAPPDLPAGAPAAAIQVRLADGRKLVVKLTPAHTVLDLQRVAAGAHATGGKPFVLKGGFPPKPLEDPGLTIEAAGLAGSAVTQVVL